MVRPHFLVPPTVNLFQTLAKDAPTMLLSFRKIKLDATTRPDPPEGPRIGGSKASHALHIFTCECVHEERN